MEQALYYTLNIVDTSTSWKWLQGVCPEGEMGIPKQILRVVYMCIQYIMNVVKSF